MYWFPGLLSWCWVFDVGCRSCFSVTARFLGFVFGCFFGFWVCGFWYVFLNRFVKGLYLLFKFGCLLVLFRKLCVLDIQFAGGVWYLDFGFYAGEFWFVSLWGLLLCLGFVGWVCTREFRGSALHVLCILNTFGFSWLLRIVLLRLGLAWVVSRRLVLGLYFGWFGA